MKRIRLILMIVNLAFALLCCTVFIMENDMRVYAADTDVVISYTDSNGNTVIPQSVNGDTYLFLPANACFESLPFTGNYFLSGDLSDTFEAADGSVNLQNLFENELQSGTPYDVTISNLNGGETSSLRIIKADNLTSVFIDADKSISEVNSDKSVTGSGTICVVTDDGDARLVPTSGENNLSKIKGRGNTGWTLSGEKKPYTITLSSKKELIPGAGKAKKWNLISDNCQGNFVHEAAGLANITAYTLYQQIGGNYAVSFEPINLYYNGEYRGVYLLTEKVEIGSTRVDIGEFENEEDETNRTLIVSSSGLSVYPAAWENLNTNSAVYVSADSDPAIAAGIQAYSFATDSVGTADGDGGYLIEMDGRFYEECSWFITSRGYSYVLKEPEFATREQVQAVAQLFQDYEDSVFSNTGFNSKGVYYTDYIDLDSIAKKYAVDLVSGQADQFNNSCFFSVDVKNGVCGKIIAGPAWDYDASNYSTTFNEGLYVSSKNYSINGRICANPQYMAIMFLKHGDFASALYNLSVGPLGQQMDAWESEGLPSYVDLLMSSQQMNDIIWNADGNNTRPFAFDVFLQNYHARNEMWHSVWNNTSYLRGVTVSSDGNTLTAINTANTDKATYAWYCVDKNDPSIGTIVKGATSSQFVPKATGYYYAAISASTLPGMRTSTMYSNPVAYCIEHSPAYVNNGDTHSTICSFCGECLSTEEHIFIDGICICGAHDPAVPVYDSALIYAPPSLNLESYIGLQFLTTTDLIGNEYTRIWSDVSRNGVSIGSTEGRLIDGTWLMEIRLAPKELTDTFTVTLYGKKDGQIYVGQTMTDISGKSISVSRLDTYYDFISNDTYRRYCTLFADLLAYSEAAQLHFNYNTDNLATAGVDERYLAMVSATPPEMNGTIAKTGDVTTCTVYSMALGIESQVELQPILRLPKGADPSKYELAVSCDGLTSIIDGADFIFSGSPRYYYAIIDTITAKQMRKTFEITVYEKSTGKSASQTYQFSIEKAAFTKLGASDTLNNLMYRMISFGDSAEEYFECLKQ